MAGTGAKTPPTAAKEAAGTERDVLARLAERGEEALQRLAADVPGGPKALKAFNDLKTRVDELGRRVRGIDALEQRLAKLEKEVAALKRAQKPKATASHGRPTD